MRHATGGRRLLRAVRGQHPGHDGWTNVQLPWAKFTGNAGGASYTLTGADIDGLTFNMNLNYGEVDAGPDGAGIYGPTPADLDLQIDDIAFMQ